LSLDAAAPRHGYKNHTPAGAPRLHPRASSPGWKAPWVMLASPGERLQAVRQGIRMTIYEYRTYVKLEPLHECRPADDQCETDEARDAELMHWDADQAEVVDQDRGCHLARYYQPDRGRRAKMGG
jgi:hypothetical protein